MAERKKMGWKDSLILVTTGATPEIRALGKELSRLQKEYVQNRLPGESWKEYRARAKPKMPEG